MHRSINDHVRLPHLTICVLTALANITQFFSEMIRNPLASSRTLQHLKGLETSLTRQCIGNPLNNQVSATTPAALQPFRENHPLMHYAILR